MRLILLLAVFSVGLMPRAYAESPFEALLKPVQKDANVLVLVDAERIRRSDFAKSVFDSEGDAAATKQVVSRSEISQLLVAAHVRGFRESMIDWQTAVLQLNDEPSVAGVAASYSGSIDKVGPTEYAVLPYGAIAVATGKKVLTVLTPAEQQQVTRTVRLASSTKPVPPSEFVSSCLTELGPKTQALIAVDLEGMFSGSQIVGYVHDCETFRDRKDQRSSAITILETLKTLMVRVRFGSDVRAELVLTFSQDIPDIAPWAASLVREVLSDTGAWISDAENWTARQEDRRLVLEGPLSLSGLRTLFSLVDSPTDVPTAYQPGAVKTPEEQRKLAAKASLTRFRACDKLVEDLKKDDRARTARVGESALWFDRYAKQIETLPSLNVDPEVLAYCDDVVLRLRVQATRYRMASGRISQQSSTPNFFWGYFNNYYGNTYTTWTRTESDEDRTRRYERASSAMDRAEQFQAISEAGVKVRRAMTEKYQVEF